MARLSHGCRPYVADASPALCNPPVRSGWTDIRRVIMEDEPVLYWPLNEPANSTVVGRGAKGAGC